ncbi:MAG: hypothetical protein WDM89_08745 [Rhizomicrobium sp.]
MCRFDLGIGLGHTHFQRPAFGQQRPARNTVLQRLVNMTKLVSFARRFFEQSLAIARFYPTLRDKTNRGESLGVRHKE